MAKQKTHKGLKKVLHVRDSGSISIKHANGNHMTGKLNSKSNRKRKKSTALSNSDLKRFKSVI